MEDILRWCFSLSTRDPLIGQFCGKMLTVSSYFASKKGPCSPLKAIAIISTGEEQASYAHPLSCIT